MELMGRLPVYKRISIITALHLISDFILVPRSQRVYCECAWHLISEMDSDNLVEESLPPLAPPFDLTEQEEERYFHQVCIHAT